MGPLDPLELALLIEATEDLDGLDGDDAPVDGALDDCDQDDEEP